MHKKNRGSALIAGTLIAALSGCGGGGSTSPDTALSRTWGGAQMIEFSDDGSAGNAQIVFDSEGNALAVWNQSGPLGATTDVMASRFLAGFGWDHSPAALNDSGGHARNPQLAVDGGGHALAVWKQHDGTRYNIWSNYYMPETGWQGVEQVETDAGDADLPQVAVDHSSGIAIAVWRQFDGASRYLVWANVYLPGAGWGTPELLQSDTYDAQAPRIAFDSTGHNALAVWQQLDVSGTRYDIWSRRYVAGAGWSTPPQPIETETGNARNPQLGFDAAGNAIVVWQQIDSTGGNLLYSIMSRRYDATTGWGSPLLVEIDNTTTTQSPQIAVASNGSAMAIWEQYDGTRFNILANRYSPDNGWATPELVETNGYDAHTAQLAIDANGNAMAVWRQYDGIRYSTWANRYTAKAGWATAELLETDDNSNAMDQQIAIGPDGNALAIWTQNTGADSYDDIWTNEYR